MRLGPLKHNQVGLWFWALPNYRGFDWYGMSKCAWCGCEFHKKRWNQQCCSAQHSDRAAERRAQKRTRIAVAIAQELEVLPQKKEPKTSTKTRLYYKRYKLQHPEQIKRSGRLYRMRSQDVRHKFLIRLYKKRRLARELVKQLTMENINVTV